jgi:hypothetical protein
MSALKYWTVQLSPYIAIYLFAIGLRGWLKWEQARCAHINVREEKRGRRCCDCGKIWREHE